MDRLVISLFLILAFSACSKNPVRYSQESDTILVSIEEPENMTKTALNGYKTKFVSGDRIKVYDNTGKKAVFRFQQVSGEDAIFLQMMDSTDTGFNMSAFQAAFYPSAAVTGHSGTSFTARISDKQTYATGGFSNGSAPMISKTYSGDKLRFKNCFGVVKMGFKYTTPSVPLTIDSLTVTSASTKLYGTFTFGFDGSGNVTVGYPSDGGKTVTLRGCSSSGAFASDSEVKEFYVVLPGIASTSGGEKVSVTVAPTTGVPFGGYFMASKGSDNKIARNHILELAAFNVKPIDAFGSYSVMDWQKDTLKVGQITVPESSYKIGTTTDHIEVQINGATLLSALTPTVKSGHFTAGKKEDGGKFYVTVSKATGWTSGEEGSILVNDAQTNSGVYINVKIAD